MIPPLSLSRADTPLQRLERPSRRLGIDVWVKRDDLTGSGLSGNKVRKLDFLLAQAVEQGADTVITCGGIQSNHCRATAVAARQLGLHPVLLLRGQPDGDPDGNLLLDRILGATLHWTDAQGYARRDQRMAELARDLRAAGRRPFVIPEGGSNAVGALGYVRAGRELTAQAIARGLSFDSVVCAVGSGGTLAGLAMAGLDARVLGVAVCDDRATFRARVQAIAAEGAALGLRLPDAGWDVLEGHQGRGYGLATPEELAIQVRFARETGIFLDPVYTGKAWCAIEHLAATDPGRLGGRVLFWHTGGLFGLFGRGGELVAAMSS
ncbi:D-cysteine desulfhydrase family protein [Myxococcota bacterium]|nr:D-cysteine desulfhydrase family protein [Myxococcota bacterium]